MFQKRLRKGLALLLCWVMILGSAVTTPAAEKPEKLGNTDEMYPSYELSGLDSVDSLFFVLEENESKTIQDLVNELSANLVVNQTTDEEGNIREELLDVTDQSDLTVTIYDDENPLDANTELSWKDYNYEITLNTVDGSEITEDQCNSLSSTVSTVKYTIEDNFDGEYQAFSEETYSEVKDAIAEEITISKTEDEEEISPYEACDVKIYQSNTEIADYYEDVVASDSLTYRIYDDDNLIQDSKSLSITMVTAVDELTVPNISVGPGQKIPSETETYHLSDGVEDAVLDWSHEDNEFGVFKGEKYFLRGHTYVVSANAVLKDGYRFDLDYIELNEETEPEIEWEIMEDEDYEPIVRQDENGNSYLVLIGELSLPTGDFDIDMSSLPTLVEAGSEYTCQVTICAEDGGLLFEDEISGDYSVTLGDGETIGFEGPEGPTLASDRKSLTLSFPYSPEAITSGTTRTDAITVTCRNISAFDNKEDEAYILVTGQILTTSDEAEEIDNISGNGMTYDSNTQILSDMGIQLKNNEGVFETVSGSLIAAITDSSSDALDATTRENITKAVASGNTITAVLKAESTSVNSTEVQDFVKATTGNTNVQKVEGLDAYNIGIDLYSVKAEGNTSTAQENLGSLNSLQGTGLTLVVDANEKTATVYEDGLANSSQIIRNYSILHDNKKKKVQISVNWIERKSKTSTASNSNDLNQPMANKISGTDQLALEFTTDSFSKFTLFYTDTAASSQVSGNALLQKQIQELLDNYSADRGIPVSLNSKVDSKDYYIDVVFDQAVQYDGRAHLTASANKTSKTKAADIRLKVTYSDSADTVTKNSLPKNLIAVATLKNPKNATVDASGQSVVAKTTKQCYISSVKIKKVKGASLTEDEKQLMRDLNKALKAAVKEKNGNNYKKNGKTYRGYLDSDTSTAAERLLDDAHGSFTVLLLPRVLMDQTLADGSSVKLDTSAASAKIKNTAVKSIKNVKLTYTYGDVEKKNQKTFKLKYNAKKAKDITAGIQSDGTVTLTGANNYAGTITGIAAN
ncbi:MAG: hypothetical protein K5989_09135 [Lachnospiraceae bacterium]|nr:hypothetical protein [Lachnospiraceae bacterium]